MDMEVDAPESSRHTNGDRTTRDEVDARLAAEIQSRPKLNELKTRLAKDDLQALLNSRYEGYHLASTLRFS